MLRQWRTSATILGIGLGVLGVFMGLGSLFRMYFTNEFMGPMFTPGPVPPQFASKSFRMTIVCPKQWADGQSGQVQVNLSSLQDNTLDFTLEFTGADISQPIIREATLPAYQSIILESPVINPSSGESYETIFLRADYQVASGTAIREQVYTQQTGCQIKLTSVVERKAQQLSVTGLIGLLSTGLGMALYFFANNPLKRPGPPVFAVVVVIVMIAFEVVVIHGISIIISGGVIPYGP